jgi:hypothetical protein
MLARLAKAPHDENETGNRHERVEALPGVFSNLRYLTRAPVVSEDAHRMAPKKDREAEYQYRHDRTPTREAP